MAGRGMPMPSRWAKPMKPGRRLLPTPRADSSRTVYAPVDAFRPGTQTLAADYPVDSVGVDRSRAVQYGSQSSPPPASEIRRRLGTVSHHSDRVRTRLSLWCEFCTVTGFFGDSIRFRTNQSVVDELLRLKARARSENGQMAVFFIDDNFAINVKRTKSLLRDIIAAGAQVHWVAQISANLLRDEELVDLIAASGGKWIFIGMESIDPANLADVNKGFNKPGEYAAVLERLARAQYLRHHFIYFRHGQRHRRRRRAHARADSHLAAGTARSSACSLRCPRLRSTSAWRRPAGSPAPSTGRNSFLSPWPTRR